MVTPVATNEKRVLIEQRNMIGTRIKINGRSNLLIHQWTIADSRQISPKVSLMLRILNLVSLAR